MPKISFSVLPWIGIIAVLTIECAECAQCQECWLRTPSLIKHMSVRCLNIGYQGVCTIIPDSEELLANLNPCATLPCAEEVTKGVYVLKMLDKTFTRRMRCEGETTVCSDGECNMKDIKMARKNDASMNSLANSNGKKCLVHPVNSSSDVTLVISPASPNSYKDYEEMASRERKELMSNMQKMTNIFQEYINSTLWIKVSRQTRRPKIHQLKKRTTDENLSSKYNLSLKHTTKTTN